MSEFLLPDVGEGLDEAEVVEWFVAVGDQVQEHQVLVSVETAKSIVEIPSPREGTIAALGGEVGESVAVGAVLVRFEESGSTALEGSHDTALLVDHGDASSADEGISRSAVRSSDELRSPRPKAAPVVRKLAAERGIDLRDVNGTGPNGRILRSDLDSWLESDPGSQSRSPSIADAPREAGRRHELPLTSESVPLRGLRKSVAQNMVRSWTSIPHVSDFREVDATSLLRLRSAWKRTESAVAPGLLALIVKATALALRRNPYLNSSITDDAIELHKRVDIGIATATPDGLLVPVVKAADLLSIREIHEEIQDLVDLARTRRASPAQLGRGTYTVNNLATLQRPGSLQATPLIRPPEAGILALGRIQDRVVAVEGQVKVRPTMLISSVADHRIVDGDKLFAFTSDLQDYLEDPATMLTEMR